MSRRRQNRPRLRLSEDQVKQGILHSEVMVRQSAIHSDVCVETCLECLDEEISVTVEAKLLEALLQSFAADAIELGRQFVRIREAACRQPGPTPVGGSLFVQMPRAPLSPQYCCVMLFHFLTKQMAFSEIGIHG